MHIVILNAKANNLGDLIWKLRLFTVNFDESYINRFWGSNL